jgi:hypothetical protein
MRLAVQKALCLLSVTSSRAVWSLHHLLQSILGCVLRKRSTGSRCSHAGHLQAGPVLLNRVAQHTADRADGQFKDVHNTLAMLKQLPPVESGTMLDNQPLYAILAALLRQHGQLYNLHVGYDDGAFIEFDALDRAGAAVRAQLGGPADAAFGLPSSSGSGHAELQGRHLLMQSS